MIAKIHKNEGRLILSICDKDIIGKKFIEGKKQLDLSSGFYKGEEYNDEDLKELIKKAYMINAVGKKSVSFLEKEGLVDKSEVIKIKEIPHTQIFFIL